MKLCSKCNMPDKEYYPNRPSQCRDCEIKASQESYRKRREKYPEETKEYKRKISQKSNAFRKYGMTEKQYANMPKACEICGKQEEDDGKALSIDHCHISGEYRGVLCQNCNHLLGKAKDSCQTLWSAIQYLTKHQTKRFTG